MKNGAKINLCVNSAPSVFCSRFLLATLLLKLQLRPDGTQTEGIL